MKKLLVVALSLLICIQPYRLEADAKLLDELYSQKVFLYDVQLEQVIYDKGSNEIIYPASMTKIMTMILALENIDDYNRYITITQEMIEGLAAADASRVSYEVGDVVRIWDLLLATILVSAADATNALAITVAGSISAFVDLMNQKATELGMTNTHYMNSHGLHHENHYSSCRDLAILMNYCVQNAKFKELIGTTGAQLGGINAYPEGLSYQSSPWKLNGELEIPGFKGGKTGYTEEAGSCFVSYYEYEDYKLILVTAYNMSDYYFTGTWYDAHKLINSFYEEYERVNLLTKISLPSIQVVGMFEEEELRLSTSGEYPYDLAKDSAVSYNIEVPRSVRKQLSQQEVRTQLNIYVDGELVYSEPYQFVVPQEEELLARIIMRFGGFIVIACVMLCILFIILLAVRKVVFRSRKRKRRQRRQRLDV